MERNHEYSSKFKFNNNLSGEFKVFNGTYGFVIELSVINNRYNNIINTIVLSLEDLYILNMNIYNILCNINYNYLFENELTPCRYYSSSSIKLYNDRIDISTSILSTIIFVDYDGYDNINLHLDTLLMNYGVDTSEYGGELEYE